MPSPEHPAATWTCWTTRPAAESSWLGRWASALGLPLFRRQLSIDADGLCREHLCSESDSRYTRRLVPIDSFIWTWLSGARFHRDDGTVLFVLFMPTSQTDGYVRRWLLTLPTAQGRHEHA